MTGKNASKSRVLSPLSRLPRLAGAAVMISVGVLLSSCGSMHPDRQVTNSVPDDYRTRHPITLAEVEHNLDVPVGSGERKLTYAARDLIRGFAQDYTALSSATMRVAIPEGAANSPAARSVANEVRKLLVEAKVKSSHVVMSSYQATAADASAPVRLSFVAVTAITDECGQWPTDLFGPTVTDNTNWENFGCATQQNLAAQIANPADLVGPRGMTPIDAQRRAEVIRIYREN